MHMIWHDNITIHTGNCTCVPVNNLPDLRKFYVRADVVIGPYNLT